MPSELFQPSPELAVIVGYIPLSWVKIVELVGEYIKENDLDRLPNVVTDSALRALVGEREQVSANELTKVLKQHITPTGRRI